LDVGVLIVEKEHVRFIEGKVKEHIAKGLDEVRLFGTILSRRVIPLAKSMSKMWEYSGLMDHDEASPDAVFDDELWSWLEMVLKVGNQRIVGGPPAFDKGHPPNLVSFSPFLLPVGLRASDHVLTLPRFAGAWSSSVLPTPPEGGRGRGQASRPSGSFPGQLGEESEKGREEV
jgi:hypothetical protein